MPPDPGNAFLLWCVEGASTLLEVISAKMRPFMSWSTWRRSMGQQAFRGFF